MSKAKFRKIMFLKIRYPELMREEISYIDLDYQLVCFRYFHKWKIGTRY
jgi:hypothetical protein